MTSTLERLFVFAKASTAHQRENFTTEALAGAIRSDPVPFFAALRARGVDARVEGVVVETQLWLAGTGRLDLVVEHGPRSTRRSIWVEVKVDAPVERTQLTKYRDRGHGGAPPRPRAAGAETDSKIVHNVSASRLPFGCGFGVRWGPTTTFCGTFFAPTTCSGAK